jgi:hypothetical protein
MNPFHGSHHDYQMAARLGQHEIFSNACEEAVRIEIADLSGQTNVVRLSLGVAGVTTRSSSIPTAKVKKESSDESGRLSPVRFSGDHYR